MKILRLTAVTTLATMYLKIIWRNVNYFSFFYRLPLVNMKFLQKKITNFSAYFTALQGINNITVDSR